jgi:hypothetical protein
MSLQIAQTVSGGASISMLHVNVIRSNNKRA